MYRSILVPLASPALDAAALKAAVRLARADGARLHVVHVRDNHGDAAAELLRAADWTADELNESVSFRMLERPPGPNPKEAVADALRRYALQEQIDLIVMARRRHSLNRLLLGSVGERLLFGQEAPILFLPELPHTLPARGCRVLLALDGSPGSEVVLADALQAARALKGSLSLLRVLQPVREAADGGTAVDALVQEYGEYGDDLAQQYLESIARQGEAAGVKTTWLTLPGRSVTPAVQNMASAQHAHIVALAARPSADALHFAHHSVTERLLHDGRTALLLRRRPA